MKTTVLNTIFFLAGITFILSSCSTSRYAQGFKNEIKNIDTLTLLNPITQITLVPKGNDRVLVSHERELISKTINSLLNKKYTIIQNDKSTIDTTVLFKKFDILDKTKDNFIPISSDSIFKQMLENTKSRYLMLFYYGGYFNPKYAPDYNTKQFLISNSITINPQSIAGSNLCVIIIDNHKKQIVYFNQNRSKSTDPRVDDQVDLTTKKLLQDIYYK